jgi:hypothetical protein
MDTDTAHLMVQMFVATLLLIGVILQLQQGSKK